MTDFPSHFKPMLGAALLASVLALSFQASAQTASPAPANGNTSTAPAASATTSGNADPGASTEKAETASGTPDARSDRRMGHMARMHGPGGRDDMRNDMRDGMRSVHSMHGDKGVHRGGERGTDRSADRSDPAHGMSRVEHMRARQGARLAVLKGRLQLSDAQQGSWSDFARALELPATMPDRRALRAEMAQLKTPERLNRMQALAAERSARQAKRADAVRAFYAALTPQQQATFDAQSPGREGRRGHRS
ncbi:MAG: Spy/CpxP family protein refolding chaperone [Variovorax sp.]